MAVVEVVEVVMELVKVAVLLMLEVFTTILTDIFEHSCSLSQHLRIYTSSFPPHHRVATQV